MTTSQLYASLIESMQSLYEKREATQIAKIYIEDKFSLQDLLSEKQITDDELAIFEKDLKRLKLGEPIQYVTQVSWFYGLKLFVDASVLIPRPETEEIVDCVLKKYKDTKQNLNVLDIGTGSGCIALALSMHLPQATITALDLSKDALGIAQKNAKAHNVNIDFVEANWIVEYREFANREYDIIVSNPPYISKTEKDRMGKSVLKFEPDIALYGDEDGMIFYQAIAACIALMDKKPAVFLELNEYKALETKAIFKSMYSNLELVNDMQGKSRILIGTN